MTTSPNGRLLGGKLLVLAAGEGASRVFGFVAMSYLFRRLGPASYGLVETTVAVMMFGLIGAELGLGTLGTRDVARDPSAADSLVRRVATAQLVSAACVFALIAAAALLLPLDPVLSRLLIGFGIALLAVPFALHWMFQGREQMLFVTLPKGLRWAVFLGGAVLLVRGPADVARLPLAEIAGAVAMSGAYVALFVRGGGRLRVGGSGSLDGTLVRDALPIGGATFIWALRMYLPVVYVTYVLGPAATGIYGASHRIVMVLAGVLDVYFVSLYPRLSVAAATSLADLRRLLARSMHVALWPTLAGALVLPWLAPWVMRTVYGTEDPEAARLLVLLAWLVPVTALRAHARFALFALNRQHFEFVYSAIGVLALGALLVPLTASMGAAGTAWAMLGSEVLATVIGWAVLASLLRDPRAAAGAGTP